MNKVSWGVLGVARIATVKVIPAMQRGELCSVDAIGSRSLEKAEAAAQELHLPKAYGSYEELLADPNIQAIYNPLPNHMHVEWTTRAMEAGKHVLCEKPLGMTAAEAAHLLQVRERTGKLIGEAFMVRVHPQWVRAREIIQSGEIGSLRAIHGFFSYNNRKPENIRNIQEYGGGALMDIGCYPVYISRWMFGEEPQRVCSIVERDPEFGTDRLSSALLDFRSGHVTFTSGTQLVPYQKVHLFGTAGRIEIEIPFNAPPDQPTRIFVQTSELRTETFPVCDQYTIQGDAFSRAVLGQTTAVPVSLEDGIRNMAVIDALFESARTKLWVTPAAVA